MSEFANVLLRSDGTVSVANISTNSCMSLDEMYKSIGCNCIDIVRSSVYDTDLLLVVDDNGLLTDRPINHIASFLYGDILVGDVLIGTEIVDEDGADIHKMKLDWCLSFMETIRLYYARV